MNYKCATCSKRFTDLDLAIYHMQSTSHLIGKDDDDSITITYKNKPRLPKDPPIKCNRLI